MSYIFKIPIYCPPAVRHQECHLLKTHLESKSDLPGVVKKSQEALNQLISNELGLPGVRCTPTSQCVWGDSLTLGSRSSWDNTYKRGSHNTRDDSPAESRDERPGMDQADVHHGTPCPSALVDENSQDPQSVSPKRPEIFQLWRAHVRL